MASRSGQVSAWTAPKGKGPARLKVGTKSVKVWATDQDGGANPAFELLKQAALDGGEVTVEGYEQPEEYEGKSWTAFYATEAKLGGSPNGGAPAPTGKAAAQYDEEGVAIGWAVNVAAQILGPGCEQSRYLDVAKEVLGWRFADLSVTFRALKQEAASE